MNEVVRYVSSLDSTRPFLTYICVVITYPLPTRHMPLNTMSVGRMLHLSSSFQSIPSTGPPQSTRTAEARHWGAMGCSLLLSIWSGPLETSNPLLNRDASEGQRENSGIYTTGMLFKIFLGDAPTTTPISLDVIIPPPCQESPVINGMGGTECREISQDNDTMISGPTLDRTRQEDPQRKHWEVPRRWGLPKGGDGDGRTGMSVTFQVGTGVDASALLLHPVSVAPFALGATITHDTTNNATDAPYTRRQHAIDGKDGITRLPFLP